MDRSCSLSSRRATRRLWLSLLALSLPCQILAKNNTKRGFGYLSDTHQSDNSLLLSSSSPITWYYNWSPYPATAQIPADALEFTPLIHGVSDAENSQTVTQINSLPKSSMHLLSFNEPDGTTSSGGSNISPDDAARAYIDSIVPYRNGSNGNGRTWNISHPSVTGSTQGLNWLRSFNESCYKIDKMNGCPTDFVAVHWYGNFAGLASWLGTLDEFYNANKSSDEPALKLWVTEMALPQQDDDATVQMMNQTLPYLDGLDYVERYAWFGAFRTGDANEWTGNSVALFNNDGGLTELGALYMGGSANGFKEGEKGSDGVRSRGNDKGVLAALVVALATAALMW